MEDQESLLGHRSNGLAPSGFANAYQYAYRNRRQTGVCRISLIVPCLLLATLFLTPFYIMNGRGRTKDDQNTDSETFNYTTTNFGLKNRTYDTDPEFDPERRKTQWERFENHVVKLNNQTPENVRYKVLYLGRHGEGYHNIKETEVGKEAWDCYWSHLDGDANSTWADSQLAPTGVAQALIANNFWEDLITTQKISPPQSYYVSPLTRCLETCSLTFSNLSIPTTSPPFIPTIKELLREGISSHTCDRRRSKTYIHEFAPTWKFEPEFVEEDPYWRANYSETEEAENRRFKTLLDDLFLNDNSTFISLSSHSGAINTILRVIGHRSFPLQTGAVIPVLIKGQNVLGEDPNPIYKGPEYIKDPKICSAPPSPTESTKPVNDIGLKKPGDVTSLQPPVSEPTTPAEPNPATEPIPPIKPSDPASIEENPHLVEQIPPSDVEVNPPTVETAPPANIAVDPPTSQTPNSNSNPPPSNSDSTPHIEAAPASSPTKPIEPTPPANIPGGNSNNNDAPSS
ncbi:hypothetical protein EYC80_002992 [Monilinia laxa]|uniref:Phosphoglycerate mutase-like protein n=1 Tax=Monilinia laxa TaxID=61186 RepID=A0A5N6KCH9_MONLA|nr:hypothetical protein EYC80_002992 [Monilinia laxa]